MLAVTKHTIKNVVIYLTS